MNKWKQLFVLGIAVGAVTLSCCGCDKMVNGVVAEAEETDSTQTSRAEEKLTLKEMVDASERYQTTVTVDGNIYISADTEVEIPEVDELHLKKAVPVQHGIEYFLDIVNVMADEPLGTEDIIEIDHHRYGNFTIQSIPYSFCYDSQNTDVKGDIQESFIINLGAVEGLFLEADNKGIYDTDTGEYLCEYQEMTGQEYLDQVDTLLQHSGLADFKPAKATIEFFDNDGNVVDCELSPEKKGLAAIFECERVVEQVPVTWIDQSYMDMYSADEASNASELNLWQQEKISIGFINNMLSRIEFSYPLEISGYSDEKLFLLPFSEIRGIFEEMLGWKIANPVKNSAATWEMDENGEVTRPITWSLLNEVDYESVDVEVSQVRLGYMRIRDEEAQKDGKMEGVLIPVWDFIGTWTAKVPEEDGRIIEYDMYETSLLTLDARDGSVVKRMFGY